MSTAPSPPTDASELAGGRPPVEHRLLGLDRRTFVLPLITVAVFAVWALIVPAIEGAVDYDDPVRAGDALIIGPTATMAPPVGWGVQSGIRTRDGVRSPAGSAARIALTGEGISVSSQTGPWSGDARAFVRQVSEINTELAVSSAFTVKGRPRTLSVDGRRGVAQEFKMLNGEGAVFGFVEDGQGIALTVIGTDGALTGQSTALGHMLASIDFDVQGL